MRSSSPVDGCELLHQRDSSYDKQVRHMPGFGDYAVKSEGIRKIPVLELKRR